MRNSRSQRVLLAGTAATVGALLLALILWPPPRPRGGAFAPPAPELRWQREAFPPAAALRALPGARFAAVWFGDAGSPWRDYDRLTVDERLRQIRDRHAGGIAVRIGWRGEAEADPELDALVDLARRSADHGLHLWIRVDAQDAADAPALGSRFAQLGARLQDATHLLAIELAAGSRDAALAPACADALGGRVPFGLALDGGTEPLPLEVAALVQLVSVPGGADPIAAADLARRRCPGPPVVVTDLVPPARDDPGWLRRFDQRVFGYVLAGEATASPALLAHQRALLERVGRLDATPTAIWSEAALEYRRSARGIAPDAAATTRTAVPLLLPWHACELELDLEPAPGVARVDCELSIDALPIASLAIEPRRSRHLLALDPSILPGRRMIRIATSGAADRVLLRGLRVLMPGPRDERRWVLHVEPQPGQPIAVDVRVESAAGQPRAGAVVVARFAAAVARAETGADGRARLTITPDGTPEPGPLFVELLAEDAHLVEVRRP